jgi:hypothetical protein
MKLTQKKLRQLITEETLKLLKEQDEVLKYWPELSPEMVARVRHYTTARDTYHGRKLGVPKRSIVNALTGPGGEVMVNDMRAKSQSRK